LPSVENVAADDALLKQYSAVIIDIKVMETNMLNLWYQVITLMMPETSHTEGLQAESKFIFSPDLIVS
jgi:conserved oligomeric Golgi complex subunit 2